MFLIYQSLLRICVPFLDGWLFLRTRQGKEDPARLGERKGLSREPRPDGFLTWIHAASVGEAQSALILIERLLAHHQNMQILVTTGTLSSAGLMKRRLPARCIHQFMPLDHPAWTKKFLTYWRPDLVLWMESELWPAMLIQIKNMHIPAVLVNGRLSDRSFRRWMLFRGSAAWLLSCFALILTQTEQDAQRYRALGAQNTRVTDNLKYSARALDADQSKLQAFTAWISKRPSWLFASTHEGEEAMAMRLHNKLQAKFPRLLTIIAPRHPARGGDITGIAQMHNLKSARRSETHIFPGADTDIYIADTMGELGLFYRAAPLAVIGRSFSDDGGGGHNPVEAAQLGCTILYGPHVQFQQQIYDDMASVGAALQARDESMLADLLTRFLSAPELMAAQGKKSLEFAREKEKTIDRLWPEITPFLERVA